MLPRKQDAWCASAVRTISLRGCWARGVESFFAARTEPTHEHAMTVKADRSKATPHLHLRSLIERFDSDDQRLIRSVRSSVRKRLPTVNELVYDYKTFFVIAYSPTDRPMESIVSIAARPDGVRLYFTRGTGLPDPKRLLSGSGRQTRFIRVEAASQLAHPDVEALIAAASDHAGVALPSREGGRLIIRSGGTKQRARRKSET